ncbi:MAG: ABC transporter permease, partial [Anaerolineae bacterium]|nr:ABC transporter permease [Anaerolineae bacterium]
VGEEVEAVAVLPLTELVEGDGAVDAGVQAKHAADEFAGGDVADLGQGTDVALQGEGEAGGGNAVNDDGHLLLALSRQERGLAEGISQARSVRGYPEWFFQLGQGEVLGVPAQLWLLVFFVIVTAIVLSRTVFGRSLYAIGNNELGARFSGIPTGLYKIIIYAFSGFMSGLAAWIFVSRVTTTRSDMGSGLELDAIAAVVLGGTSIFGGSGSIVGTVIGFVLIQLLKNGLSLAGVTTDGTIVVIGSVLILAILINNFIQRRTNAA